MNVRITHLKAPWPAGAKQGDVVELAADAIPAWAVNKCEPAEDAEVTISYPAPAALVVNPASDTAQAAGDAPATPARKTTGKAQAAAG